MPSPDSFIDNRDSVQRKKLRTVHPLVESEERVGKLLRLRETYKGYAVAVFSHSLERVEEVELGECADVGRAVEALRVANPDLKEILIYQL